MFHNTDVPLSINVMDKHQTLVGYVSDSADRVSSPTMRWDKDAGDEWADDCDTLGGLDEHYGLVNELSCER